MTKTLQHSLELRRRSFENCFDSTSRSVKVENKNKPVNMIIRWPKSVTAISICSRQFQFAHGNFSLLTAISICSFLTAIGHREEPGRGNLDAALWVIFFLVLCWRSDSEIHENRWKMFCGSCGSTVIPNQRFCTKCGSGKLN